jgi:hypothetical protein
MDNNLPIDFEEKVRLPPPANGLGYPYRISASDLMNNFIYASLNAEEGWIEKDEGSKYQSRKLMLPKIPESGTHVLGCIDGEIQWIETESC